jgi:hypothetical protein
MTGFERDEVAAETLFVYDQRAMGSATRWTSKFREVTTASHGGLGLQLPA